MGKRKKKKIPFGGKNKRKIKQCYHNDICRLKRDNFSSEVEITRETVWTSVSKKRILRKI